MTTSPEWFHNTILNGIANMAALCLQGSPPSELMPSTAKVWIETLWRSPIAWDESVDVERIMVAFGGLMLRCERWPSPSDLIKALPSRPEPLALPPPDAKPAPPIAEAKLRALSSKLAGESLTEADVKKVLDVLRGADDPMTSGDVMAATGLPLGRAYQALVRLHDRDEARIARLNGKLLWEAM